MSSKKQKKKRARQVLANSLITDAKVTETQKEQLKNLIREKVEKIYAKPVSSSEVISDMNDQDKCQFFKLPQAERAKKLKTLKIEKKNQASIDLLPKEYLSGLVIGMKKCLKGLEFKTLKALIYDCEVNLESINVLFDKGQVPMVPLAGISSIVRSVTGFPALCLALPVKVEDAKIDGFFQPIMDLVNQIVPVTRQVLEPKLNLPDIVPKNEPKIKRVVHELKNPTVTLLKRDSIKDRAWHPPALEKTDENTEEFKSDFISFGGSKKRPGSSITKSSKFKKTRLELMK